MKRVTIGSEPSSFFQAEDSIRDLTVTGVQTCALPIYREQRGHFIGWADVFNRHRKELLPRVTIKRQRRGVHRGEAQRLQVENPHRERAAFEQHSISTLRFDHVRLRSLAVARLPVQEKQRDCEQDNAGGGADWNNGNSDLKI